MPATGTCSRRRWMLRTGGLLLLLAGLLALTLLLVMGAPTTTLGQGAGTGLARPGPLPPRVPARPAPLELADSEDLAARPGQQSVYFGAWLDDSQEGGQDGPAAFQQRMGFAPSVLQYVETLPVGPLERTERQLASLRATGTDVIVLLTVYTKSLNLTEADVEGLVDRVTLYVEAGHSILLRLNPEMNGNWFVYGQRPTVFRRIWQVVHAAVQADPLLAERVAFMWCPNPSLGYPFSAGVAVAPGSADFRLLDTNEDGRMNALDDPYSPYYPGDELVDWVALSIYYFGPSYPFLVNALPPPGSMERLLSGAHAGQVSIDFYATYAEGREKPFFIAETGAAFHRRQREEGGAAIDPGPGELALKRAFWRQYLTSDAFYARYPRLQGVVLFEYEKPEEETIRDFRVSRDPAVRTAFLEDLQGVWHRLVRPRTLVPPQLPMGV